MFHSCAPAACSAASGIYAGDLFFALIDDDTLYLKVDDSNRTDFEAREMSPFRPYGDDGEEMQYYAVPADLLDDPEALRRWHAVRVGADSISGVPYLRPTAAGP